MERHSVAPFGFRRLPSTVQAQKVSHGPQRGILVAGAKPAERIQAAAGKMEVHDRTTPEIDKQSGSRTLNHYGATSIYDDFGSCHCRQYRNQEDCQGDESER